MSKPIAKVTGSKQLDKNLAAMGAKMRKKPLRTASREVAKFTLRQAKAESPHDEGELERSLAVKAMKRSRKNKEVVGANVETKEGLFKGETFYGGFVEFGTKQRQTKEGYNRGRIQKDAFAFLRPALYAFQQRKKRIFIAHIHRWFKSNEVKK